MSISFVLWLADYLLSEGPDVGLSNIREYECFTIYFHEISLKMTIFLLKRRVLDTSEHE